MNVARNVSLRQRQQASIRQNSGTVSYTHLASIVSGRELAVQMGLPRKSIPGVSVIETAAFGRNIELNTTKKSRYIESVSYTHLDVYKRQPAC